MISSKEISNIEYQNLKDQISSYNSPGDQDVETTTSAISNVFYNDPYSWTLASQYGDTVFSIPIVDGKAVLEIPESDIVSLLFVEASYIFDEEINQPHELPCFYFSVYQKD